MFEKVDDFFSKSIDRYLYIDKLEAIKITMRFSYQFIF